MTVAITVAFILFLLIIVIVTVGASIIEEKERVEKERVRLQLSIQDLLEENREVREAGRLIIKSKEGQITEDIRPELDVAKAPPGITITEDDLKDPHIQKKIAESIAWLEEEFTKKRIERQRKAAQECLDRKREERKK